MQFWVTLIKTKDNNDFLKENCTHVTGPYWIFEGENWLLDDNLSSHIEITEGAVPALGDMNESELIDCVRDCLGVDLKADTL